MCSSDLGTSGLGGYQTISIRNNGAINSIVPGSGSFAGGVANLESGQGFIVHTGNGALGSITFNESNKLDSSRLVARPPKPYPSIRVNLLKMQGAENVLTDGVINLYDSSATDLIDQNDALKLYNPSENIAIKTNDKYFAIENRNTLKFSDTIFYQLSNLKAADYSLEFTPESINSFGVHAFLEDLYLNTQTPISTFNISNYNFSVTSVPGSYRADRFRLVFRHQNTLPVTILNLQATRIEKTVKVQWNVQNEINISHYSIERSSDGLNFSEIGAIVSNEIGEYQFNDLNPYSENNYYRIIGLENNGYKNYSKVVKVAFDKEEASITVTPNPIGNDRTLHMNFKNMLKGDYQLDIYDWSGRKVGGNTFNVKNENEILNWKLPTELTAGKYNLSFYNAQSNFNTSFIINQ